MSKVSGWKTIRSAPDNTVVLTKIDDEFGPRNECKLRKFHRLWFTPSGDTYVYYTPTHWKPNE